MVNEKPVLPLGSFLFPKIFQAFRMAIQPSKLALAFAAVTIICVAGGIMDSRRTVIVALDYASPVPHGTAVGVAKSQSITELDVYLQSDARQRNNFIESRKAFTGPAGASRAGVFSTLWHFGAGVP